MIMDSYVDYMANLAPPWMLAPKGRNWLEVFGRAKDLQQVRLREALKARFVAECSEDALPKHGSERQIYRAPYEPTESYRARLVGAWDAWERAGTSASIVSQLNAYGYPNVEVFENDGPGGGNWYGPPDRDATQWWRFWVRINQPIPWTDWAFGDGGHWGDDRTWGSTATSAEVNAIRSIIRKWKPAHALCAGVIVEIGHNLVASAYDLSPSAWTAVGLSGRTRNTITDSSATSMHGINGTLPGGIPAVATTMMSVEAKAGTLSQLCMSNWVDADNRAVVDLVSGEIVFSNRFNVSVRALRDGWWRVTVQRMGWGTNTVAIRMAKNGEISYQGDGAGSISVRSVQLWQPAEYYHATLEQNIASTVWAPVGIADRVGDTLTEDNSQGEHLISYAVPDMPGGRLVMSADLKAGTRPHVYMRLGHDHEVIVRLSDGTITYSSGADLETSVAFLGDGWYRCSISCTPTDATIAFALALANNTVFTGSGLNAHIRNIHVHKSEVLPTITWPVDIWPAPGS